jgi:cytochrome oxidase Cu insertion factor (SCO1/SenC/PrrC family)
MTIGRTLMVGLMLMILSPSLQSAVSVGDEAPDFTLTDTKGNTFTLSEQQGKVVLLFFMGYS